MGDEAFNESHCSNRRKTIKRIQLEKSQDICLGFFL